MTKEQIQAACKRAGVPVDAQPYLIVYFGLVALAHEEIEAEEKAAKAEEGKAK